MAHEGSPSSVMYADFKELGLKNRDVAMVLLDTTRRLGDGTVQDRIEERSLLSRTIVHVAPGELSAVFFKDFPMSTRSILTMISNKARKKTADELARGLVERYAGASGTAMAEAIAAYGGEPSLYRNTIAHIAKLELKTEMHRALLLLMQFIVAGCTGDPGEAARIVDEFSSKNVGAEFRTTEAAVDLGAPAGGEDERGGVQLGLIRIIEGKIKGGSPLHRLAPTEEGTLIGALASAPGSISDVDEDVSRQHARIYRKDGRWYIVGLKSTNGTTVISGADKVERVVEPPRKERGRDYEPEPMEIFPSDTICLGSATRFMVMPIWEA